MIKYIIAICMYYPDPTCIIFRPYVHGVQTLDPYTNPGVVGSFWELPPCGISTMTVGRLALLGVVSLPPAVMGVSGRGYENKYNYL